jgi:hypothetical protein
MKPSLTMLATLALAAYANAQIIPATPAERQLSEIDRAAAGSRYYLELTAQSLSRLHSTIFITNDETLTSVLAKLGPQKSAELLDLYFASATAVNQLLAASGSPARAPDTATREWTWNGNTPVVTPLVQESPDPES